MGRGVRERPRHQQRAPRQPDGPRDHGLQRHHWRRRTTSTTTPSASASTIRGGGAAAARSRPIGTATGTIINNHVHDNNKPNTGTGGLVGQLPPGGGILVLGRRQRERPEEPDREQRLLRDRHGRLLPGGRRDDLTAWQSAGRWTTAPDNNTFVEQHAGRTTARTRNPAGPAPPSLRASRRTSRSVASPDSGQLLLRQHDYSRRSRSRSRHRASPPRSKLQLARRRAARPKPPVATHVAAGGFAVWRG